MESPMKFMLNPISALRRFLDHQGGVWVFAAVLLLLVTCVPSDGQNTPVVLAPLPQLQFFDQTGIPLAFGCVFTYQVATVTPLGTYTDYTGTTLNANPVILTAGGSANIWLQAGVSYTFQVRAAGGTNCANGSTLYTVNGIGGGSTTLTTVVPYSATPAFMVAAQNQLFEITLTGNASAQPLTFVGVQSPGSITFQITQDGSGGHTWSWPANSIGGCTIGAGANQVTTQQFVYNGSTATAIGPCVTGNGPIISTGNIFDFGLTGPGIVCVDGNNELNTGCGSGGLTSITVNGQTIASGGSGNVNSGNAAHSLVLNEGNGSQLGASAVSVDQVPVGRTSADPVGTSIPNCPDTSGNHLNYATSTHAFSCGTSDSSPHQVVAAATLSSSCQLASNNGEWNCSGTFPWGATLSSSTYQIACLLSQPMPTGSYAIPAGYDAHIFFGAQTTTNFTYYLNDDHSGSNGAIYTVYCEAFM
jgi:hypothetical protein